VRSLGRDGLDELIERCCASARRMADRLAGAAAPIPGLRIEILNDVVLNQVLVRFLPEGAPSGPGEAADILTRDVIARVQADGTCWLGGTTWHDLAAMRVSVSNWQTTAADIDVSAEAILRCAAEAAAAAGSAGSGEASAREVGAAR
jgi:glutamate/tyrosine decarboxylase-like PLP-dependent enzyme